MRPMDRLFSIEKDEGGWATEKRRSLGLMSGRDHKWKTNMRTNKIMFSYLGETVSRRIEMRDSKSHVLNTFSLCLSISHDWGMNNRRIPKHLITVSCLCARDGSCAIPEAHESHSLNSCKGKPLNPMNFHPCGRPCAFHALWQMPHHPWLIIMPLQWIVVQWLTCKQYTIVLSMFHAYQLLS